MSQIWNLDPPPGFQGPRTDKPLTVYYRHLPHWRQDGATYFVTFRLGDSLPRSTLRELEGQLQEWNRRFPPPQTNEVREQSARQVIERIETWLDQGRGACWLRNAGLAEEVVSAMHHFDGSRYELDCYVVMPNHVHAILQPTIPTTHSLESILGSWKQFSSGRINKATGKSGELWQVESFDRILRDQQHLFQAIQYIGRNPQYAGLACDACPMWIRPEWEALGWTFEWRRAARA